MQREPAAHAAEKYQ